VLAFDGVLLDDWSVIPPIHPAVKGRVTRMIPATASQLVIGLSNL